MQASITGGTKWQQFLLKYCKEVEIKAGILEGATNMDGEPIAPYAACNEFGTASIPARPFLRNTVAAHWNEWTQGFRALLQKHGPEGAAQAVGKRMVDDITATIKSSMPPPNSAATIQRKSMREGPRGTLIDTGAMIKAVEFEIGK